MRRFKKKLTLAHQEFVNKYCYSQMRNPKGIYEKVLFCEDEDVAIVIPASIYYAHKQDGLNERDFPDGWGCVNMANQLLVPFDFKMVYDFGHFLIGKYCGNNHKAIFNKRGKELYELSLIKRTTHKAYIKLYDYEKDYLFRIAIRKMAISKGLFYDIHILDNGLAYLKNEQLKVGAILFSKLKLPFEYEALSEPQNGYMLGIKPNDATENYDCLIIKVRNQIMKEDSIHPTGITLFTNKKWDEVISYFEDKKQFEREVNSIICYNQQLQFNAYDLNFFPYHKGLPQHQELEDEIEEDEDDYNPWSRENYSYEEAMYDALGGEMEAIWNID